MPLYEYRCRACGSQFEAIQKFSDAPLSAHESCGGEVERLLSLSSFALKGSGWYLTDYARKGDGTADGKAGKSESKEKGGEATGASGTGAAA